MLLAFSAVLGAVVFGLAGWLGRLLADTWYGDVEREAGGPLPPAPPGWIFVVVPACLGTVAGIRGVQPLQGAVLLVAVLSLTVCAATDARTATIPDLFTLGSLIVVLGISAASRDPMPLLGAAFAFVPFGAIALFSRGSGMGWGDVKLATLGGALVGLGGITVAVLLASLSAYGWAVVKGRARRPIAFGPYLAATIGAVLALGNPV